mgnify:CR=1 FL=1
MDKFTLEPLVHVSFFIVDPLECIKHVVLLGTSVGEIFGAMLGGAALCLLVMAISYLVLRKYRNTKQKQTTK